MQVLHSTTTLIQSPYTFYFFVHHPFICLLLMITIVLHPYFKLAYVKWNWCGAEEQAKEISEGNFDTKNWKDKAESG